MLKRDYMLQALNAGAYRYKAWVLHVFTATKLRENDRFPYRLYSTDHHYYFLDPATNEEVVLEDVAVGTPPFHIREPIALKAGEVANLKKDLVSNYGRLLTNMVALVYPLGDKIEYVEGEFNIRAVEAQIEKRLTTDPEHRTKKSVQRPDPIYVSEYLKFVDALLSMEGYSQLCVPSATPKTMTRDPRIPELRAALVEKYKDRLDDPAVIAQIDAELIKMDREWIKGDLGEGFYFKSKSYDIVRKKSHLMHGYEAGFGLKPDTITNSLSEGWDIDKMPGMVNSLREGTYGRGSMTALGGYATKVVNRTFQNVSLIEGDCGTTLGWSHEVTNTSAKGLVGFYYLTAGKKTVLVTDDNAQGLVGTSITLRTPQFCKAKGVKFCRYCVGEPNVENENALGSHVAAMTSQLMLISMSQVHGKVLKTTPYKPQVAIS